MRGRDLSWLLVACSACGFNIGASGDGPGDGGGSDVPGIDAPVVDGPQVADGPPNLPRRKVKLTFQNGSRPVALDNFVALVVLDATKIDYALTKAGGADLRFTDDNGAALSYEIDEWVPGGTSYVWVRVPLIDASSDADFIYMHYGDQALPPAQAADLVWAGQSSVWHLSQDPGPGNTGDIKDSSPAHNHGTATAPMATADRVPAVIGNGMHFVGNLTGITAASMPLGTYTWSMWIRGEAAPTVGTNREPLTNGDVNFNYAWDHGLAGYVGGAAQKDATAWHAAQPPGAYAAMTWYFVTSTYDGTQLCIFRDGNSASCTASGGPLAPTGTFQIGLASSSATASFRGWVDEVHVAVGAENSKRINADYANQHADPQSPFVLFGATEVEP